MTHPTDDPLRARINRSHLVATINYAGKLFGWRGDTIADDLMSRFDITLRNAAAPQPAPAAICKTCGQSFQLDAAHECPGLQPAPAPADERAITGKEVMPDANARPIQQPDTSPRLTAGAQAERAAMIEVIWEAAKHATIRERDAKIADALLAAGWTRGGDAAGLREEVQKIIDGDYDRPVANVWRGDGLPSKHDTCPHSEPMWVDCPACMEQALRATLARPSAPETLAWAVVGEDGKAAIYTIWRTKEESDRFRVGNAGEVKRVAIRVVEDGA